MCKKKRPATPAMPEMAALRAMPRSADGGAVRDTMSRRWSDRARSGSNTILTSGLGVLETASTSLKSLLGA